MDRLSDTVVGTQVLYKQNDAYAVRVNLCTQAPLYKDGWPEMG